MTDHSFLTDEQRTFAQTPEGMAVLSRATRDHVAQTRYGRPVSFEVLARDAIARAMSERSRLDVAIATSRSAADARSLSNRQHISRVRYY